MIKKKKLTKLEIISAYMVHVEQTGNQPSSIASFTQENNITEKNFLKHFKKFASVEKTIFKLFFTNTIELLDKSDDYRFYDSRYKLLTFYFTFFEILSANRTYVVNQLKLHKSPVSSYKVLSKLKKEFTRYIATLEIETIDLKQETLNKVQDKGLENSAWIQLLLILKFWIDDHSDGFEKTDVLIEKFVNTGFDLINTKPINSLIDLGKFIIKEKIQFS